MKRQALIVFLMVIVMCLASCSKKKESEIKEEPRQETIENKNDKQEQKEEKKDKEKLTIRVYKANPEDGTLSSEEKECDEMNEKVIWELLKESGLIQEDSNALSIELEGNDTLVLDVDSVFGEQLRSLGTSGEREMIGCVVNTYLDAYRRDKIKITEEGGVLYSGHREYAEYMTWFE